MTGAASPATDPVAEALKAGIRVYQYTLRPFIGAHCRFHPHCSAYAIEALSGHGALRGTAMAARRILRCHPWNPGGYDPVPAPRGSEAQGSEARGPIPTPPMQPPRGH